jgi:hypothetical protein
MLQLGSGRGTGRGRFSATATNPTVEFLEF